jgi:hypothetical protein
MRAYWLKEREGFEHIFSGMRQIGLLHDNQGIMKRFVGLIEALSGKKCAVAVDSLVAKEPYTSLVPGTTVAQRQEKTSTQKETEVPREEKTSIEKEIQSEEETSSQEEMAEDPFHARKEGSHEENPFGRSEEDSRLEDDTSDAEDFDRKEIFRTTSFGYDINRVLAKLQLKVVPNPVRGDSDYNKRVTKWWVVFLHLFSSDFRMEAKEEIKYFLHERLR